MRQVILVGDSLIGWGYITGWVTSLSVSFAGIANVVNAGLGGYNTRWILENLLSADPYVPPVAKNQESPLVVLVCLGANDAADPSNSESVPLSEYSDNLLKILKWIETNLRPELGTIVVTPSPPSEEHWARSWAAECGTPLAPSDRTVERTRKYRDASIEAAGLAGVRVVDLFKAFGVSETDNIVGQWKGYFSDGLHFNKLGDAVAFQAISNELKAAGAFARAPAGPNGEQQKFVSEESHLLLPRPYHTRAKRIVIIGDQDFKHGAQWTGELARHYMRSCHVANSGIWGATSGQVLENLLSADPFLLRVAGDGVLAQPPVLALIILGNNDTDERAFETNLFRICEWTINNLKTSKLILCGPSPAKLNGRTSTAAGKLREKFKSTEIFVVTPNPGEDPGQLIVEASLVACDPSTLQWEMPHYLSLK